MGVENEGKKKREKLKAMPPQITLLPSLALRLIFPLTTKVNHQSGGGSTTALWWGFDRGAVAAQV